MSCISHEVFSWVMSHCVFQGARSESGKGSEVLVDLDVWNVFMGIYKFINGVIS